MSCKKCQIFQGSNKTSFIRVDNANIEVGACEKHLKMVFDKLNDRKLEMEEIKIVVWVQTLFEGFHRWLYTPNNVKFLREYHRHIFKIKLGVEVTGDDREVEFFQLKRKVDEYINKNYQGKYFEFSCEMIAAELFGLKSLGVILGGVLFFATIGGASGGPLAGSIFDVTGSYSFAFLISVMVNALAIIFSLILLRSKGKENAVTE